MKANRRQRLHWETQAAKGGISETEENRQLIASIVEQAHETLKE